MKIFIDWVAWACFVVIVILLINPIVDNAIFSPRVWAYTLIITLVSYQVIRSFLKGKRRLFGYFCGMLVIVALIIIRLLYL